jgi:hypothetical protein
LKAQVRNNQIRDSKIAHRTCTKHSLCPHRSSFVHTSCLGHSDFYFCNGILPPISDEWRQGSRRVGLAFPAISANYRRWWAPRAEARKDTTDKRPWRAVHSLNTTSLQLNAQGTLIPIGYERPLGAG